MDSLAFTLMLVADPSTILFPTVTTLFPPFPEALEVGVTTRTSCIYINAIKHVNGLLMNSI